VGTSDENSPHEQLDGALVGGFGRVEHVLRGGLGNVQDGLELSVTLSGEVDVLHGLIKLSHN
jgi:hypothetical protein